MVSVAADRIDPANEGRLVHVVGMASTGETLSDPDFGVAANAIHLRRKVEMYQWQERSESRTEKKVGGATETTTTYSYDKAWSERSIDSTRFEVPDGHGNPDSFPYAGRAVAASQVSVGAFELSPSLIARIGGFEPLAAPALGDLPLEIRRQARREGGGLYLGRDPASPEIGDLRIAFETVTPQTVSLVAQQVGRSFAAYRTSNGGEIELLHEGTATAEEMFSAAETGNRVLTWVLRLAGFLLLLIGFNLVVRPLSVLADVLPPVGNLVALGTGLVASMMAATVAVGTVAVAWVFYRPVLGISLLALALALVVWIIQRMRGAKTAGAVGAAPPPPPPAPAAGG